MSFNIDLLPHYINSLFCKLNDLGKLPYFINNTAALKGKLPIGSQYRSSYNATLDIYPLAVVGPVPVVFRTFTIQRAICSFPKDTREITMINNTTNISYKFILIREVRVDGAFFIGSVTVPEGNYSYQLEGLL